MKPTARLINTSRGPIGRRTSFDQRVDEQANRLRGDRRFRC
jgi:lactate dehydrogenase-like 2-hydroxyacid dehydrogenase